MAENVVQAPCPDVASVSVKDPIKMDIDSRYNNRHNLLTLMLKNKMDFDSRHNMIH